MSHDKPLDPKVKKALDQAKLNDEQIQKFLDEQTTFALACLMMDIHTGTVIKNKNMVANAFMRSGVVIRNNPGYPERLRAAQEAIKAEMKKQGKLKEGSTPLPTDTALGIEKMQGVIDMPPPTLKVLTEEKSQ
jgi:hypothetical protein